MSEMTDKLITLLCAAKFQGKQTLGDMEDLAKAIIALTSVDTWRPIETAPRDGTIFLAHGDGPAIRSCPFICVWDWDDPSKGDYEWRDFYTERVMEPTHWQPLPPPPKGDSA